MLDKTEQQDLDDEVDRAALVILTLVVPQTVSDEQLLSDFFNEVKNKKGG